jgi:hypothetical protein
MNVYLVVSEMKCGDRRTGMTTQLYFSFIHFGKELVHYVAWLLAAYHDTTSVTH